MLQSTSPPRDPAGLHVAIIMDGNGRWAESRGWPRLAGHRGGALAVRRVVEAARRAGVGTLTLYAFSSDNWHRPAREVVALMRLFRQHLASETARCVENGVRLTVLGRRDRLPAGLLAAIRTAEAATAECALPGGRAAMQLRVAVDYSARESMLRAIERCRAGEALTREAFERQLSAVNHAAGRTPEVDLLIRSGGERRLSDFLLWECAYAELVFTDRMWPDFDAADLGRALEEYGRRERRFGAVRPANDSAAVAREPKAS